MSGSIELFERFLQNRDMADVERIMASWYRGREVDAEVACWLTLLLLAINEQAAAEAIFARCQSWDALKENYGPLHAVMESFGDRPEIITWCLEHGADIEQRGINNFTPLHNAANRGRIGSVAALIRHGADIDAGSVIDGNDTPLMCATECGHGLCVLLLLASGADVNRRNGMTGETALDIAVRQNHTPLFELMERYQRKAGTK